jgi:high-affinity Fe2+/Pb2+ permease
MTFDQLKELLDRYGIAAVMLGWFAFRLEGQTRRLYSKVNRLIIAVMLILRTLRLAEEEEALMDAISDDDDSGGKVRP